MQKDIIQILDGDTQFGGENDYITRLPYLRGTDICDLSAAFGFPQEYDGASRWVYMDRLLRFVISQDRCDELLCYLFDLKQFYQLESLGDVDKMLEKHQEICVEAIKRINVKLVLGRHELQLIDGHFYITEIGKKVQIETPKIKSINIPYIQGLSVRCEEDFNKGNYDSVITKSRTLIEEVLVYIIEKNNETVTSSGDIGKLFNQVKTIYNMHQDKSYDGRVNSLLSGLQKIIDSIGAMRNVNSDSHGVGSKRIIIKEREAKLAMNSTIVFCEYILSIGND